MNCKLYFIILLLTCVMTQQSKAIDASIDYALFKTQESSYLELYLQILSRSAGFKITENGDAQSTVSIVVDIINQKGNLVLHDSLILNSPDGSTTVPDFKHVMRYELNNGHYSVSVTIMDMLKNSKVERSKFNLDVHYDDLSVQQSMIQFLSSIQPDSSESIFTKNGMFYEVLPYGFCNNSIDELIIYNEVYNTAEQINADFLTHVWISKKARKEVIIEFKKRTKSQEVVIVITKLDINDLPSGNYDLHVDILNREGIILSSEIAPFQRLKIIEQEKLTSEIRPTMEFFPVWVDTLSKGSLRYSLKAIFPLLEYYDVERLNQALSDKNIKRQKHFLYNFWAGKAKGQEYLVYDKYMKVARAVDKTFYSGFGHGFETDRGIIFMRYGQPDNSVSIDNEPGAFPYEIWQYDKLHTSGQTNVKLIFYNPSLASKAYLLLHSNAEGETRNDRWERSLYSGASSDDLPSSLDVPSAGDGIMRNARAYYNGM